MSQIPGSHPAAATAENSLPSGRAANSSSAGTQDPAEPTGTGVPEHLGRYRLLSKVAKGGMAEVFAARSYGVHGFEKTVALKRILPKFGRDPQFVRMMVDEAKISVLLNHPNIAQVLELGEQDGDYFIVMEFVAGQSLGALIKRLKETQQGLPVLEACYIIVELLQGLHAAHIQSDMSGKPAHIIHRDVSPQNILLSFDGHVKVIDFGIARAHNRLEATEIGTIKGKLRYLAPEMIDPGRFSPDGDFDHRVDVFAAGIVLWEMLAGRALFPGDDELKVYDDITDGRTPDLSAEGLCDAALMKILFRALARALDQRYPSAEEFADALRAYVYRADPAFTHKRVAAILDRTFPLEKAELSALERGQALEVPGREKERKKPSPWSSSSSSSSPSSSSPSSPSSPDAASLTDHPFAPISRPSLDGISEQPTQIADVRGLEFKEITVITLVSRQHVRAPVLADDPTLTVGVAHPRTSTRPPLVVRSAHIDRVSAVEHPDGRGALAPAPTRSDDEDPGHRRQLIFVPAAVGVLLALGIVAVVDLVEDPLARTSIAAASPPLPLGPIKLTIRSTIAGAIAVVGEQRGPLPLSVQVRPGEIVSLRFAGVGVVDEPEQIQIPTAQRADFEVERTPHFLPVGVEARIDPPHAAVLVAGHDLGPQTKVAPNVVVVVDVSAPGFGAVRQEFTPVPGVPLLIEVKLEPNPVPAAAPSKRQRLKLKPTPGGGRAQSTPKPTKNKF